MATHPAPGGQVGSGCGVVREQFQDRTNGDLTDTTSHLDDGSRALHSAAIQRQPWEGWTGLVHDAPTVARILATIGGSSDRNWLISAAAVVQVSPTRTLP